MKRNTIGTVGLTWLRKAPTGRYPTRYASVSPSAMPPMKVSGRFRNRPTIAAAKPLITSSVSVVASRGDTIAASSTPARAASIEPIAHPS